MLAVGTSKAYQSSSTPRATRPLVGCPTVSVEPASAAGGPGRGRLGGWHRRGRRLDVGRAGHGPGGLCLEPLERTGRRPVTPLAGDRTVPVRCLALEDVQGARQLHDAIDRVRDGCLHAEVAEPDGSIEGVRGDEPRRVPLELPGAEGQPWAERPGRASRELDPVEAQVRPRARWVVP